MILAKAACGTVDVPGYFSTTPLSRILAARTLAPLFFLFFSSPTNLGKGTKARKRNLTLQSFPLPVLSRRTRRSRTIQPSKMTSTEEKPTESALKTSIIRALGGGASGAMAMTIQVRKDH